MNKSYTTTNPDTTEVLVNYDKLLPLMKMKNQGDCLALYIEHRKREQLKESLDQFSIQSALGWKHERFSNALWDLISMNLVLLVKGDHK